MSSQPLSRVWLPVNSDRQALASKVIGAVDHVKRCRAAAGASAVCDAAVQMLLTDLAGTGPTLTCCRMLVHIVVNVAANPTPVTSDALQRALTVCPALYPYLITDALLYTRDVSRIRPLLRYLFQDEKFSSIRSDLHSRLVLFTKQRPEFSLEIVSFLCDVHHTMRAASSESIHAGFLATFHDEATLELADAIFDLDIQLFGADACQAAASQLVGLICTRLCSETAIIPSCRALLHLFSLDLSLANDVRIIVILSWVLRFHAGLQTDRDLRFVLETIFVCARSFDNIDVDLDFHVAVTSLLPPLLELISSSSEWPSIVSRASILFNDLQQMRSRPVTTAVSSARSSSQSSIDSWTLHSVSAILHPFTTLVTSWADLDRFVRRCAERPCESGQDVRAARFMIDTIVISGNANVIRLTAHWMQSLMKASALEFLPLFSTILYRLRNDTDGDVRIELLYALPYIARSATGLTRVLRIFLPFTQHRRLRSLSIRLLSHLWLVEPRSFSRLQQILLESRSQTNTIATKRAIAASIIEICKQSPTESLTIVPLLQELLYDQDTVTIALSIAALRELCVQGELDLHVAYQLLEERGLRQFCVGKSVAAFKQLFRLIECDDAESDAEDGLPYEMLRWLWQQTSPSSSSFSASLRAAAYESLIVLAERSLNKLTPNYLIRYFSDSEVTLELHARLQDERSGQVRAVLERFVSAVCALQLQHRTSGSKKEPAPNDCEAFAVTFPTIIKEASKCVKIQWQDNERPNVRDIFAIAGLIGTRRSVPLPDLVASVTAPNLSSITDLFVSFALTAAWSSYMDRFVSEALRQKRDADLSGIALYLSVFEQIEDELRQLDLGDSRVRGNVVLAKSGLSLKTGAWGHSDIATRLHCEIHSAATNNDNALIQTARPAALLALGASVAALHPTDTERRSSVFRTLFETFRSSSNEQIVAAACLSIAIASSAYLQEEDDAVDAVVLLKEAFSIIYTYLKQASSDGVVTAAAGVALWSMWPILVRVIAVDQLVTAHDELLHMTRFGISCSASLYCLGGLSSRLFSMGAISASQLSSAVDVYIDELKKPRPLPGALTSCSMLLITLRYASNYVGLPKSAPQQVGKRLVELISQPDAQPVTVGAAMVGFVALLGIDVLVPFHGARLPTDLCGDQEFTADVTEMFSRSLTVFTTNAYCSYEAAEAASLCQVFLATATSSTTRAMDSLRVFAPGTLLRMICDSVDRRSVPSNSALATTIRSIAQIRRYSPSVHLPLPVSALSSLLNAITNDLSISALALRTAIVKLMLWQASYDNTLKRSIAALISDIDNQPVCVHRVIVTGLDDVANCVDPGSVITLLNSMPSLNVDLLLVGLRRILVSAFDQTVRDRVVQLLGSTRLRRLVTDIPRYAACFAVLSPELVESILPVDDDVAILTRFELVRNKVLRPDALIATRAFVVGPQAFRPAFVDGFAQVCAQFPLVRRLTWILDLFDLMAVARDPLPALRAVFLTVTAWVNPLLPGDIRTLSGSLPKALEGCDDMGVDSVVRRVLRFVNPSKDDATWNNTIRRHLIPSLISLAVEFPRCSPVIISDMFSVI